MDNVEINQIGEHEYEVVDYDNETYLTHNLPTHGSSILPSDTKFN